MSRSQFYSIKLFILRHAWLNRWDKHMTTLDGWSSMPSNLGNFKSIAVVTGEGPIFCFFMAGDSWFAVRLDIAGTGDFGRACLFDFASASELDVDSWALVSSVSLVSLVSPPFCWEIGIGIHQTSPLVWANLQLYPSTRQPYGSGLKTCVDEVKWILVHEGKVHLPVARNL